MHAPTPLGPFDVGPRLGEGGMGTVYRGEHRTTGVPVAVKVIRREADPDARRRFHGEVQAHAALQHPGVVYLFDYGEIAPDVAAASGDGFRPGDPFVAMELADRGTLRDAMPLDDWETVCRLLVQILDALAYAHARGVVHRDLKPENFLLFGPDDLAGSDWRVKLADFGIAHALQRERDADTEQLEGAAGTPLYMTPEQCHGRWREYGPWTDLYAVGCIAWELVSGRPPFGGDSFLSIAMSHERDARPPLEPRFPVPDQLASWIHRAMAVDPAHRFRRAADAAWALPRGALADLDPPSAQTVDGQGAPSDPARGSDETHVPTLASTVLLGDRQETGLVETVAAGQGATREPDATQPTPERILSEGQPPVPEDWRPEHTEPLPAPLVGAGLGLFGLREPPFVNRSRESHHIWETLQEVVEDQTLRIVVAEGDAGTGKSRLVEWIATRAHEVGAARVLRAVHTRAGGPNEGLRGALERHLRTLKMTRGEVFDHLRQTLPPLESGDENREEEASASDDRGRVASGGSRVARTERDARALTEYLRPTDDDTAEIDGPRYRFSSADQTRGLLVRILRRLASRRPVLLWLDDLQWSDEAMGLVEELLERRDQPPPVLVVATVRSDLLRERTSLEERIAGLDASEASIRLALEPLEVDDQRTLLQGLLPLQQKLARRLAERTEGHPLFAMQLLAHWIDEGVLEADPDGFHVPADRRVELPADIHALWMDRIDRIVERARPETRDATVLALERAAALGREIDSGEWQRLCDAFDGLDPARLRHRLVDAGLAEDTDHGWAFAHGLLVDSLERRARREGRRKRHHRRCAELLEAMYPDRPQMTAARRADHRIEAGQYEMALEPLLQRANRLNTWGELEQSRRALERRETLLETLDLPTRDPRAIENDLELANLDFRLGAAPDAILARLEELRRRAEQTDHPRLAADAWRQLSFCRRKMGRWKAAADAAREASRSANACGDPTRLVDARLERAWANYYLGHLDDSRDQFSAAHRQASEAGDDFKAHLSRIGLGWVAMSRGAEDRASALFEQTLHAARDAGYRILEAMCLNGLGEMARFRHNTERARERYRRYGELKRELNQPEGVAVSALNLAQVELMAAHFPEAAEHLTDAERQLDALARRDSKAHLLRIARLTHAAGVRSWSTFDALLASYSDGWPDDAKLIKDHPWLLQLAGDYAAEAGDDERARKAWHLARDLWNQLGDDEAAADLAAKLDAPTD